jgi:hypothetical protein
MRVKFVCNVLLFLLVSYISFSQSGYWQQGIRYKMDVDLDVVANLMKGRQVITYQNNSPDTLNEIYFHTYWNAFQPGSSMDERSRESGTRVIGRNRDGSDRVDWDGRIRDRILHLKPEETGYCRLTRVVVNGVSLAGEVFETIQKFRLAKPLFPRQAITILTQFEAQVPIQIRRSGRDSQEGIRYSMTQWYPKVVEYDATGWTANPYVFREFYGVWGDYEVNITLDKEYKIGASGVLSNADDIGWGYDKPGTPLKTQAGATRTWRFVARKVHDFAWVADPNYFHITRKVEGGPLLHFIYKAKDSADINWKMTADECVRAYPFMKEQFGPYPWTQYSFLHGGDGGMEYAMATLIRSASLGTAIHEWIHSWYQQLLGTNESLYAWMDEGFTTYGTDLVMSYLKGGSRFPFDRTYESYIALAKSRLEEPMTTHADHFTTNYAYSTAAYSKGAMFLVQLGYIISDSLMRKTLLNYYDLWKYKHPTPADFVRVAEKTSGIELDWYREYWINTTKSIDYLIDSLWTDGLQTFVRIERKGEMPMPLDIKLVMKDSTSEWHYVPLNLMYAQKPKEGEPERKSYPYQKWTHRQVIISSSRKLTDIISVEIDPSRRMADVDRSNNKLELNWN